MKALYLQLQNTVMSTTQIRQELHDFINKADKRLLTLFYAMMQADTEENYQLSEAQKEELDRRLNKYEAGEMKFSSWGTVKERIRHRVKNGL